jgi:hypothetical protein
MAQRSMESDTRRRCWWPDGLAGADLLMVA